MSERKAYEKKLQGQLDEWRAEIDKLKAEAESAEGDAGLVYHQQVEDLRNRQEDASERLEEMKAVSDDRWENLKVGLDSACDSLSRAIKSATSSLK